MIGIKINLIPLLSSATVLVAAALAANGMPAPPHPVVMLQPDGSYIDVRLAGDEHGHTIFSADGSRILRHDAAGMLVEADDVTPGLRKSMVKGKRLAAPSRIGGESGYPAHGSQRALAVLVQFPETAEHPDGLSFSSDNPRQLFDQMLNQSGYNHGGATGSVHEYYHDSSNGLFDLTFDVYGPVTLEKDLAFYGTKINGEDLNAWNMAVEACTALDGIIDFNDYDRDHDGIIDNVYVFYAGPGAATGGDPTYTVWQHAADIEKITGRKFIFDGVRLNHYACSNEYRDVRMDDGSVIRQTEGIGTVCHEFSHVLGLPDLYDTTGQNVTPGEWSLMDTGCHLNYSRTPPLMSAYERSMLGWIDPRVIGQKPESVTLRDLSQNEACLIPAASENECFILENRQISGWDSYLPGHGLLVWHINYMEDLWQTNRVNSLSGYQGVEIIPADGSIYDSRAGDPFPGAAGVTVLSDDGYPNMLDSQGKRTNAPLSNIREAGRIISFDVCRNPVHLDKVTGVTVSDIMPSSFMVSWQPVSGADAAYRLYVYTKEGDTRQYVNGYSGLILDDTDSSVSGLQPNTGYYVEVVAFSGNVTGDPSDEISVTTPDMSFEYITPVAEAACDVTGKSFTACWQPVEGASDYALTVYTKTKGNPDYRCIDFSNGLENLPTGWTTNCGFTMSINGYYGESAPSLSMTDDYARLQSPSFKGNLRSISFWYRERSGSGKNSLEISVLSADGEWIEADCIDLPERMGSGTTYLFDENSAGFPSGCKAVRFVYRRVDSGTLAMDDIRIGYNDKFKHNYLNGWNQRQLGSVKTDVTVENLQEGVTYCYTVKGIDSEGVFTLPSNEISVITSWSGVTTAANDSIQVIVDAYGEVSVPGYFGPVIIVDMQGRIVPGRRLPCRGVYIACVGDSVCKVVF